MSKLNNKDIKNLVGIAFGCVLTTWCGGLCGTQTGEALRVSLTSPVPLKQIHVTDKRYAAIIKPTPDWKNHKIQ